MRKTGKKLVAVIAAVSMTISMVPSSGHATVRSISMQQAKASERSEAVQGVVKQKREPLRYVAFPYPLKKDATI